MKALLKFRVLGWSVSVSWYADPLGRVTHVTRYKIRKYFTARGVPVTANIPVRTARVGPLYIHATKGDQS